MGFMDFFSLESIAMLIVRVDSKQSSSQPRGLTMLGDPWVDLPC